MSELFYTNQKLNAEWENAFCCDNPLNDFDTGTGHLPLDRLQLHALPSATGALSLPPMGQYSTPVDVTDGSEDKPAKQVDYTQLAAIGALVAGYLLFLPM